MNDYYIVNGWMKNSEEDIYNEGCTGEASTASNRSPSWQEEDLDDLIDELMSFTGCEKEENVLLNACGEKGRIDIQLYETKEGFPISDGDGRLEEWKEGKLRLWLTTYTFHVEKHVVEEEWLEASKDKKYTTVS